MAVGATTALAAFSAAQTASSFFGGRNAGKGARAQGEYEAELYGIDADLAEELALDAVARGREAEIRQRSVTRRTVGSQRARMASAGLDVSSGTAADLQAEAEYFGELDAIAIRNNARREAWGYKVEAVNLRNRGRLARLAGGNREKASKYEGYSTLLTGAADFYDIFRKR